MIKKIFLLFLKRGLWLYLYPLRFHMRVYLYVRDIFFSRNSEHFYRSINYIKTKREFLPGDTIIDIGAYNGFSPKLFSSYFPDLKIIGFEPNPEVFKLAIENTRKIKNIELHRKAIGPENGFSDFFVTSNKLSSSLNVIESNSLEHLESNVKELYKVKKKIKVEVMTLDSAIKNSERVLLLKIDSQGNELNILRSGMKVLKKTKYILLEMNNNDIYRNSHKYYQVDEFLRNCDFKLEQIYSPLGSADEFDCLYIKT